MVVQEVLDIYRALVGTHLSSYSDGSDWQDMQILNRAYWRVARFIRYFDPAVQWYLAPTTDGYHMGRPDRFFKTIAVPYRVTYDGKHIPLMGMREFLDLGFTVSPVPVGIPRMAYWQAGKMYVYPAPDEDAASKPCYVAAECYPTKLIGPLDYLDLPIVTHEAVAYLAAVLASDPTASDEVAFAKVKTFSDQAYRDLLVARDENESLILGPFTQETDEYIH